MWMASLSPLPSVVSSASAELGQMVCCVLEGKTQRNIEDRDEVIRRTLASHSVTSPITVGVAVDVNRDWMFVPLSDVTAKHQTIIHRPLDVPLYLKV